MHKHGEQCKVIAHVPPKKHHWFLITHILLTVLFCDYVTKNYSDSYDDEVEHISINENGRSKVYITDSHLDSSVNIKTQQWVEVKT